MAQRLTQAPAGPCLMLNWSSGTLQDGQNVTNGNRDFPTAAPPGVLTVDVHGASIALRRNSAGELSVNFGLDDFVLQTALPADIVLLTFDPPVRWAMTQVAVMGPALPLTFTARCFAELSDGTRAPEVSVDGETTTSRDGSAASLGLLVDEAEAPIKVLAFAAKSTHGAVVKNVGINQVLYAYPEMTEMAAVLPAAVVPAAAKRSKKKPARSTV